jgi:hypothetical protein
VRSASSKESKMDVKGSQGNEWGMLKLAESDGLTTALINQEVYLCKYYCFSCNKLLLPAPHSWPTRCSNCGSEDIDIEKDMESGRLEDIRFGTGDNMPQNYIDHTIKTAAMVKKIEFVRTEGGPSTDRITKESLVEIAAVTYPVLYKGAADEDEAEDRLVTQVGETLQDPDQVVVAIGAACWQKSGFPVIRLGHKRAAALMATDITEQSVEFVRPPFDAFFIELPDGLLHVSDQNGEMQKATGVLVHARTFNQPFQYLDDKVRPPGTYWNYITLTDTSLIQWKMNRLVSEIAGLTDRGNDWVGIGLPLSDYDTRLDLLVGRLICSTCIMMSNPENLKTKIEATRRNKSGKKPLRNAPVYKVFMERQPINVDVRHYVSAYMKGERDSPHVRLMVRGHHKMQAHGKQLKLRKLLWIEPYMRGGTENDPIMRSIYVAKDKDGEIPKDDELPPRAS